MHPTEEELQLPIRKKVGWTPRPVRTL